MNVKLLNLKSHKEVNISDDFFYSETKKIIESFKTFFCTTNDNEMEKNIQTIMNIDPFFESLTSLQKLKLLNGVFFNSKDEKTMNSFSGGEYETPKSLFNVCKTEIEKMGITNSKNKDVCFFLKVPENFVRICKCVERRSFLLPDLSNVRNYDDICYYYTYDIFLKYFELLNNYETALLTFNYCMNHIDMFRQVQKENVLKEVYMENKKRYKFNELNIEGNIMLKFFPTLFFPDFTLQFMLFINYYGPKNKSLYSNYIRELLKLLNYSGRYKKSYVVNENVCFFNNKIVFFETLRKTIDERHINIFSLYKPYIFLNFRKNECCCNICLGLNNIKHKKQSKEQYEKDYNLHSFKNYNFKSFNIWYNIYFRYISKNTINIEAKSGVCMHNYFLVNCRDCLIADDNNTKNYKKYSLEYLTSENKNKVIFKN